MNTVQNHIKELLFEQDCVVIPDFGGFVTNFDCAKIDASNRFITPPQKWLAFNALLKNDDGLLSNYVSQQEQITREQANLKIKSFVEDTKRYLNFDNSYQIEGLGVFSQNEENKIQFQPKTTNFYSESFGLENIFLKKSASLQNKLQVVQKSPVVSDATVQQVFASEDRESTVEVWEDEEETTYRRSRFSKVLPYVYGVVGTLMLASVMYFYDNSKTNLGSLNPFKSSGSITLIEKTTKDVPQPIKSIEPSKVDAQPFDNQPVAVESVKKETIINSDNRFFIIIGSFGTKQNAKNLMNTLKSKGFENASLIYPNSNEKLIKVSAGGFNNEAQAEVQAQKVAQVINQDTWIYKK